MNISILAGPYFPIPPQRGGAVEKSIWQVALAFTRAGHSVTIMSRQDIKIPAEEYKQGIRILRKKGFAQSNNKIYTLCNDLLYALRWLRTIPKHDVLLVNDLLFPLIAPFFLRDRNMFVCLGRTPNRTILFHIHTKAFIVPSKTIHDYISRTFPHFHSRTRCIGYCFDPTLYYPGERATTLAPDSYLYVGRIHPAKGLTLLIEAFAIFSVTHPTARLTIIGPHKISDGGGGIEYLSHIQKIAPKSVSFLPPEYDERRLSQLYRSNQFFCYPSNDPGETFGVSILEAMACGCIPLVSPLSCFTELIQHNKTGFMYQRQSVESILEALELLSTYTELARIQSNALKHSATFSPDTIATRYLELFERDNSTPAH